MTSRSRIAILYICTGKYHVFWDKFHASAQKNLFPQAEKHFFVFSDAPREALARDDMTYIYQPRLGWPNDTLKRFHMFSRIADKLQEYDFIFFFNANIVFLDEITEEILPSPEEGLVVVQHPGYYAARPYDFPYEQNRRSTAYINCGKGKCYICGGVNGGTRQAYTTMIQDLVKAIDTDMWHGIVAVWHDESHINKYIIDRPYKLLSPAYAVPENVNLPFAPKILILDKSNYGGHEALRNETAEPRSRPHFGLRIQRKVNRLLRRLSFCIGRMVSR